MRKKKVMELDTIYGYSQSRMRIRLCHTETRLQMETWPFHKL